MQIKHSDQTIEQEENTRLIGMESALLAENRKLEERIKYLSEELRQTQKANVGYCASKFDF
jgi:hypothetical protein